MNGLNFNTDRKPTCEEIVFAMLSGHPLGQPVSTGSMIADFRSAAPARMDSDDEIVAAIVSVAIGRTMAVVFDHRDVPDRASRSWLHQDATR